MLPVDHAVTCTVVVGEVRFGVDRLPPGARRADLAQRTAAVLVRFTCLPIDPAVADHYAQIKVAMKQRVGRGIGENDLWIAATALSVGAVLVSRDADVQGITGLIVEDWSV